MRRWRLVVTPEGGGGAPLAEAVVEGGHWLAALQAAQRQLGEPAGVPAGASCAVGPDEHVAIHDGHRRRSLFLAPETSPSFERPELAAPVPGPPPSPAAGSPPATPRKLAQTMAYNIRDLMPQAPPASPAGGQGAVRRTVAYNVADLKLPTAPGNSREGGSTTPRREVVVGGAPSAPQPGAARPAPAPPSPPSKDHGAVLTARDVEPSQDSPLRYRERTYYVHPGTERDAALALLRSRLATLQRELASAPPGKYVNLAAFDHVFDGEPGRPPLVTLQWMDWRGEPEVGYPEDGGGG